MARVEGDVMLAELQRVAASYTIRPVWLEHAIAQARRVEESVAPAGSDESPDAHDGIAAEACDRAARPRPVEAPPRMSCGDVELWLRVLA